MEMTASCSRRIFSVLARMPHSELSSESSAFIRLYCAVFARRSEAYLRNSSPLSTGAPLPTPSSSLALLASSASMSALSLRSISSRACTCSRFLLTRLACWRNIASLSSGSLSICRFLSSRAPTARTSCCLCACISRSSASPAIGCSRMWRSSSMRCCFLPISCGSSWCAFWPSVCTSTSSLFMSLRMSVSADSDARFSLSSCFNWPSRCSA
mmetsp:Transcript_6738/g.15661  ORF Transcript_6738/g.15661 Transcript_6738/m.15661 type:complete len:212 (-) Transcript_6738:651-1286(-)